jgi:hypothetical protein
MKCYTTLLRGPITEWDLVARENSSALEESLTSQFLIETAHDGIPTKRLEEGMPLVRCDEAVASPVTPNWNNRTGESYL